MPKLIKDGKLCSDEWSMYRAEKLEHELVATGHWVLPLTLFQELAAKTEPDYLRIGVSLKSSDELEAIAGLVDQLKIVAIDFQTFTDGRSFSQARMLREHYDFAGEIRATGAFIQDQMFYLSRCGVNSFVLDDNHDIDSALASLNDFTESYQAACDEPQPLFRRRV